MGLPDTPAGRQAAWVLEQAGSEPTDDDITARFSDAFLAHVPAAAIRQFLAGFPRADVQTHTGGDREVRVWLRTGASESIMSVAVEPTEPHRIVGLLVKPATPSVAELLREPDPKLDIAEWVSGLRAGGAVCATHRDGVSTVRAYGPVAEDAIFEIGSITKTMTATLLATLARDGVVGLDDQVARYLPDTASMPPGGEDVTLRELATHTSGLPRLPVNLQPADMRDPYAGFTIEQLFDGLAAAPIGGGGRVAYSNFGYSLLGQVLARAAGSPFEALLTEQVLEPFGMTDARVGPDPSLEHRRVRGHADGEVVPHWTRAAVTPAGGVEASAADVLNYAIAHAGAGEDTPAAMTHQRAAPYGEMFMGLAWVIVPTERGDVLWHNGGTGGFRSFAALHPASRAAIVVLANCSDDEPDAVAASTFGALLAS